MFDGILGTIAVIVLVIIFLNSFSWKKEIKAQTNPDEELGKAARRFFKMVNKENG